MFLDFIVSAILFTVIFSNPLSEQLKLRYKFLIFAITLLNNLFLSEAFFTTYLIIALILLVIIFKTQNRLINIIAALSSYIISVVCNYALLLFLQLCFSITMADLYSRLDYQVTFYIVYLIITYVVTYLLGRFMKKHFSPELSTRYRHTTRLVFLEILLCTSILAFNITYGRQIGYPSETIIFNSILFFIYFLFSTALLVNVVRANNKSILAEQKEQQYSQAQDYMHNLEQTSMKLREFKHDYLNTLLTLSSLIHVDPSEDNFEESRKELIAYFDKNINPEIYSLSSIDTQLIELSNIRDAGLKSLISAKLQLASLAQIDIRVEIANEVSQIPMEPMDIARILGIFLDNAIDETTALAKEFPTSITGDPNSKSPTIYVAFIHLLDHLEIIIENSCLQDNIPLEKLSEYGYSTKEGARGYGLYETAQILSQYKNIIHETTHRNGLFRQTLLIYSDTE